MVTTLRVFNSQARAMDRAFERMMGITGYNSPLTMIDSVFDRLESITRQASLPKDGEEFTLYNLVPVTYKSETQEDGSVLFRVINKEEVKDADTNEEKLRRT